MKTYWSNDKLSITVDFQNGMISGHTFVSYLRQITNIKTEH